MNNLQKTLIERYTEKKFNNRNFTYRDYIELRRKLTNKNVRDTQKQNKVREKIEEISKRPTERIMTPIDTEEVITASVCGGLMLGAGASIMMGEPDYFPLYTGAIMGTLGGTMASVANILAFQEQPLTNAINRSIIKAKDKKVRRIERRKELRDYTLYCFRQQERENTPTYEDFLQAVKDSDNDLSM